MNSRGEKISEISKKYGLDLITSGKKYKILCPFHEEKTPSCTLNDDFGSFFCFGCGASGGINKFTNQLTSKFKLEKDDKYEIDNFDADKRNLNYLIPFFKKKFFFSRLVKSQYLWILQVAWGFFMINLQTNNLLKVLIYSRGISLCSSKIYGLGFASKKSNDLFQYLEESGFKKTDIIRSGLVYTKKIKSNNFISNKDQNIIRPCFTDMFRDRLIIPIKNNSGIVIGFGGRIVNKKKIAKYINSSDSNLFKKKRILFSEEIISSFSNKTFKTLILTEGYLDAMSLFQNGIKFTVASLGTSFSSSQLEKLHLICLNNHIIISFDSDNAGKIASEKILNHAFEKLKKNYFCTSIINYENQGDNKDPDEYVYYKGSTILTKKVMNCSEPILKWYERNLILRINSKLSSFINSNKSKKKKDFLTDKKIKLFDKNFYVVLVSKIFQFNHNLEVKSSSRNFKKNVLFDNFFTSKHSNFIFKTEKAKITYTWKDLEEIKDLVILCSFLFPCFKEDVFQLGYLNLFPFTSYFDYVVKGNLFSNIFIHDTINIFKLFQNFFNQNPFLFTSPKCFKNLLMFYLDSEINLYSTTQNIEFLFSEIIRFFMVLYLNQEKKINAQQLKLLDFQIRELALNLSNENRLRIKNKIQTLEIRRSRIYKVIKIVDVSSK